MEIRVVSSKDSAAAIQRLYDIMTYAYKVTEMEIWGEKHMRMSTEEFHEIIKRGELIGAWMDAIPVGSIHAYPLREGVFAFGLLSVDFDYKGQNIGRKLIAESEKTAIAEGAQFMELEILRLKHKELIGKKRLKDWYERMGYRLIETVDFIQRKPRETEKVEQFIAPSVFDCYRKKLI